VKVYEQLNAFIGAAFPGYSYGENCEPKCIGDNYGAYQYLNDDIQRAIYIWFFMPEAAEGDGGYIHPLPLQVLAAGKSECTQHGVTASSYSSKAVSGQFQQLSIHKQLTSNANTKAATAMRQASVRELKQEQCCQCWVRHIRMHLTMPCASAAAWPASFPFCLLACLQRTISAHGSAPAGGLTATSLTQSMTSSAHGTLTGMGCAQASACCGRLVLPSCSPTSSQGRDQSAGRSSQLGLWLLSLTAGGEAALCAGCKM
jgi:hypothetical protein